MRTIMGKNLCNGCKHSSLHYCDKYKSICLSMRYHNTRYQIACPSCNYEVDYQFEVSSKEDVNIEAFFRVPGLKNINAFKSLKSMRNFYPEVYLSNRDIIQIYDSFPGAIWNGRQSNFIGELASIETLTQLRDDLEQNNLSLNLTWNNHLITKNDCFDRYCNMITEVFHNGKHSITVSSPILFEYLKNKYPNYEYYQSIISDENDDMDTFHLDDNFDKIVLNRHLNNNWDVLSAIPKEQRKKIEILCNDTCTPWCKRMAHYSLDNQHILERSNPPDYVRSYCMVDHDFTQFNNDHWSCTVTPEMIDKYIKEDYHYFKLCSRGDSTPELLIKIIPYFIKPEYQKDVFCWALNGLIVPETQWEGPSYANLFK